MLSVNYAVDLSIIAVHAILVYAWVVFPGIAGWLALRLRRRARVAGSDHLPTVAILLSAYNEEGEIGDRIKNLLALDYPRARWRAFIGVDGSKDNTAAEALAAAAGRHNITVIDYRENRGKMAVLKDLVAAAGDRFEILAFTDANTAFEPDALRHLCRPFSDAEVGGVCGRLQFVAPNGVQTQENAYWAFENWLKAQESDIDSCLGANGAIYAIRRELFWREIPSNTIIDDFVIGMKVRERNYRMVYEPSAIAVEELPVTVKDEWKRRVRIGAGNFQALAFCRPCLSPSYGLFAWTFWSHKVLRWFTPHLMAAGALLAGVRFVSSGNPLAGLALLAYTVVTAIALLGDRPRRIHRILQVVAYFVSMQLAILAGFRKFVRGNLEGRWERTAR